MSSTGKPCSLSNPTHLLMEVNVNKLEFTFSLLLIVVYEAVIILSIWYAIH